MKRHIHVFGASGSGTSTIGAAVAERLGYSYFDGDFYFWEQSGKPFTLQRDPDKRIQMMQNDLEESRNWVLGGSISGWAEEIYPLVDLAVFVYLPKDIRIERLQKREVERYGERIKEGGDRYQDSLDFIAWASTYDEASSGRSLLIHEEVIKTLKCPVIRIVNLDLDESIEAVLYAVRN